MANEGKGAAAEKESNGSDLFAGKETAEFFVEVEGKSNEVALKGSVDDQEESNPVEFGVVEAGVAQSDPNSVPKGSVALVVPEEGGLKAKTSTFDANGSKLLALLVTVFRGGFGGGFFDIVVARVEGAVTT